MLFNNIWGSQVTTLVIYEQALPWQLLSNKSTVLTNYVLIALILVGVVGTPTLRISANEINAHPAHKGWAFCSYWRNGTHVKRTKVEPKGLGRVLDLAILSPNHQIHIFPGCPVDRFVIHMCHTGVSGCHAFNTELLWGGDEQFCASAPAWSHKHIKHSLSHYLMTRSPKESCHQWCNW